VHPPNPLRPNAVPPEPVPRGVPVTTLLIPAVSARHLLAGSRTGVHAEDSRWGDARLRRAVSVADHPKAPLPRGDERRHHLRRTCRTPTREGPAGEMAGPSAVLVAVRLCRAARRRGACRSRSRCGCGLTVELQAPGVTALPMIGDLRDGPRLQRSERERTATRSSGTPVSEGSGGCHSSPCSGQQDQTTARAPRARKSLRERHPRTATRGASSNPLDAQLAARLEEAAASDPGPARRDDRSAAAAFSSATAAVADGEGFDERDGRRSRSSRIV
jgi:hypothetical protein